MSYRYIYIYLLFYKGSVDKCICILYNILYRFKWFDYISEPHRSDGNYMTSKEASLGFYMNFYMSLNKQSHLPLPHHLLKNTTPEIFFKYVIKDPPFSWGGGKYGEKPCIVQAPKSVKSCPRCLFLGQFAMMYGHFLVTRGLHGMFTSLAGQGSRWDGGSDSCWCLAGSTD